MNITKVPIIQIIKNDETIEVNPLTSVNNIGISSGSLKLNTSIVDRELSFGKLISSQFSVQLFNINDNLEGCSIQLFLEEDGVRTSKFKGIVESSKRDNIGGYRDIIAYDWLYYNREYDISNWWNNFWVNTRTSATIQEIRQSLITYLGFTNDSKTYVNDSIVIPNNFNFYTDLKLDTILKMICELQVVFPHIDENGNMEFISITNTNTSDLTGLYEGNNSKWEDYTTDLITGVGIYSTSNDLSQLIGTTDNVYNISGNLFALTLDAQTLNTLGNNILSAISNIQFTPSKIKMIVSDFDLKLGQRITTPKGYGYVMTNSLSGVCLIEQTIESKSMGSKLSQRVDSRNDTLIEGARMSKFEQDIDGFNLEVQRIDNVATQASSDASEALQTAEGFEDDIATANQNAQTALNNSNRAIVTDTLHYLATPLSSGVTTSTSGWTTTTQSITETNKYLWTYHTYTYADNHTADTTPVISGVYGNKGEQGQAGQQGEQGEDGIGITEVTQLYYVSNSSTVPSAPSSEVTTTTTTSYNTWTKGIPAMTTTYKYMFTCDQIKYTNNTFAWTTPVLDNALSTAFSEIKQMADQIVLKVDNNGNVVKVALSSNASTGSNVLIKGDNIQLDGDVTITSGFVLNAGVIQSANYVAGTSGTKIDLTNGLIDSTNVVLTGNITIKDTFYMTESINNITVPVITYTASQASGGTPEIWDFKILSPHGETLIQSAFRVGNQFLGNASSANYATSAGSATNATKWNNLTDDSNKLNITDTWIPVYSSGKVQHCIREFWSSAQHCDWNNTNKRSYLVTMSCLAFWNGAYNSNGSSNFRYLGPTATIGGHTEIYKSGNTTIFGVATDGASIRTYGNVNTFRLISASQFVTNSSHIVKENIEPITEERAKKLLNLNVVTFDYIEEVGGEKNKVGLIAEDTLDILPDIVTVPTNYNEEKTKQKIKNNEAADVMSIDYSKLTPYLIKMAQIQQRQIDNLKQSNSFYQNIILQMQAEIEQIKQKTEE